jgi:hypothetical protein
MPVALGAFLAIDADCESDPTSPAEPCHDDELERRTAGHHHSLHRATATSTTPSSPAMRAG